MESKGVRRGEVYQVDLALQGGRLRKTRPVLVVQNDLGNRVSPETIVVAIRDAHGGRLLPIFVLVKKGLGGLQKDSIVDAGHIVTVGQAALVQRLGAMPSDVMNSVDKALRVSLALWETPH